MVDAVLIAEEVTSICGFTGRCLKDWRARRSVQGQRFEVSGNVDKTGGKEARVPFSDDGLDLLSALWRV